MRQSREVAARLPARPVLFGLPTGRLCRGRLGCPVPAPTHPHGSKDDGEVVLVIVHHVLGLLHQTGLPADLRGNLQRDRDRRAARFQCSRSIPPPPRAATTLLGPGYGPHGSKGQGLQGMEVGQIGIGNGESIPGWAPAPPAARPACRWVPSPMG